MVTSPRSPVPSTAHALGTRRRCIVSGMSMLPRGSSPPSPFLAPAEKWPPESAPSPAVLYGARLPAANGPERWASTERSQGWGYTCHRGELPGKTARQLSCAGVGVGRGGRGGGCGLSRPTS